MGSSRIKISYRKLWIRLARRGISKVAFRWGINMATGTMTKLNKDEEVALSVLLRACEYLDCDIGDICEAIRQDWSVFLKLFEKEYLIWACLINLKAKNPMMNQYRTWSRMKMRKKSLICGAGGWGCRDQNHLRYLSIPCPTDISERRDFSAQWVHLYRSNHRNG